MLTVARAVNRYVQLSKNNPTKLAVLHLIDLCPLHKIMKQNLYS